MFILPFATSKSRLRCHGSKNNGSTKGSFGLFTLEEGENAFSLALHTLVHFLLKLLHRLDDSAQNGSFEGGLAGKLLPGGVRSGQFLEVSHHGLFTQKPFLFVQDGKDPGIEGVQ